MARRPTWAPWCPLLPLPSRLSRPAPTARTRAPPPAARRARQAVNWLRRQWSEGNNAVLADEQGLGKSASVLAFLQGLRADFACPGPVLLVAPAASLPFWEGAPRLRGAARGGVPVLPGVRPAPQTRMASRAPPAHAALRLPF